MTDARGLLLAWSVTAANRNGVTELLPLLDAIPAVQGLRGRPRQRPTRVIADRGYDHDKYRRLLRARGLRHSIARRQTAHGSGLGRDRWVVERTISHLHNKRRLLVCTDRTKQTHDALLSLAACLLCYSRLRNFILLALLVWSEKSRDRSRVKGLLCWVLGSGGRSSDGDQTGMRGLGTARLEPSGAASV